MYGGHALNANHLAGPHSGRHNGDHGAWFRTAHVLVDKGDRLEGQKFGEAILCNKVPAPIERAVALADGIVELNARCPIGADLWHSSYDVYVCVQCVCHLWGR